MAVSVPCVPRRREIRLPFLERFAIFRSQSALRVAVSWPTPPTIQMRIDAPPRERKTESCSNADLVFLCVSSDRAE